MLLADFWVILVRWESIRLLWDLFVSFFRIGLLTFGGGYAMLPMLQREVVDKHHWITEEEVLDCYAIGQCTPGVIAVNTATFVGYMQKKVPGAVVATVGVISPSLIIIAVIATLLQHFADYPVVIHAFAGIRVAVAVLVTMAVVKLFRTGIKNKLGFVVMLLSFLLTLCVGLSPVWIVLGCIAGSLILALYRKRKEAEK